MHWVSRPVRQRRVPVLRVRPVQDQQRRARLPYLAHWRRRPGPVRPRATTTGTTSSPALSTAAGIVTGLASAQTTGTSNTIGATNPLATTPIGTTTPGAPSSTSPTTPTTAITPMTAISTVATGATSSASTTGASATTTAGITTGFIGGTGTLSQTTVAPTSFFTLDFNAKGQPVVGGTKNASSWRSVSPSQ